jgi:hypothetical protein
MKLKAQLAVVDMAFAGARIERGVISAGYLNMNQLFISSIIAWLVYVQPCHSEPSNSEKRVEDKEEDGLIGDISVVY